MDTDMRRSAGLGAVVVLGYVLLFQALTAAIVMLAQFIVSQIRALRSVLAAVEGTPEPIPAEPQGQEPAYRVGGGLMRVKPHGPDVVSVSVVLYPLAFAER